MARCRRTMRTSSQRRPEGSSDPLGDGIHQWRHPGAAGDPGRVIVRRLSNTEYDNTIRDLTGVDLHPTRQFPSDGAAGEGFTNAGDALGMSPGLLQKYFNAAKEVAAHAVLLPDGIRFSASD